MGKNVLLLMGSPRKGGNSQQLAMALAKGAKKAGHNLLEFDAGHKKIGGCLACEHCWSTPEKPCVQQDDMYALFDLLKQADVLVLSCPVYFYGMCAQIKAPIDRFYPYCKEGYKDIFPIKESVFLATAATDDREELKAIAAHYHTLVDYMGWTDRGEVIADSVWEKEDITQGNWLKQAEKIGEQL